MDIPGPRYGNVEFDGFRFIPWDFKAHSIDPARGDVGKIPTNGYCLIYLITIFHEYIITSKK